jgi:hypothetical protein
MNIHELDYNDCRHAIDDMHRGKRRDILWCWYIGKRQVRDKESFVPYDGLVLVLMFLPSLASIE